MPPTDASEPNVDQRYTVVARRYRPKSFEELVGQQHVGKALCNAIETNRVGHAYLFTGARGVGKTSTARIFAKALNDPGGPTVSPDGTSDVAQAIDAGEDVDVLEIDGASNRGIDEIRSLRANVGVRPSRSRYKIYIIDEVHMLTQAAFNALLKTLEEPPAHVKFIFCTTDPEKIPITVLSRCQRFDFSPVKAEEIMARLREIVQAEGVEADDEALRLIARRADGSMRDSQSLLEQVISFGTGPITAQSVHVMLGTADDARLHEMAQVLASGNAAGALQLIDRAASEGIAAGQLAEQLLGYFRDLLAVTVGCPPEMQRHTGESLHDELRALGVQWGLDRLLAIVGMIDHTLVRIRHTVHGRVLLEATLVQICHLPDLKAVSDLVATLSTGTAGNVTLAVPRGPAASPGSGVQLTAPEQKKKVELNTARVNETPAAVSLSAVRVATQRIDSPQVAVTNHAAQSLSSAVGAALAATTPATTKSFGVASPAVSSGLAPSSSVVSSGLAAGKKTALPSPAPLVSKAASATPVAEPVASLVAPKSRIQRIREMESHPYVKHCIDLFDGEIIRIDTPKTDVRSLGGANELGGDE